MSTSRALSASALALAILAGSSSAIAATHSDFTKSYPLQTLKTFAFKQQHRISRDPVANNDIWANDMRQAIRTDLAEHGMIEATSGNPDFYVAFHVGLKEGYDVSYVSGMPVFHRRFRSGRWSWPGAYEAWAVPYTKSTVIVDVIDAQTNQLVWRGYDTGTLDAKNPDKTLDKAVDHVVQRLSHDTRESRGHLG